MDTATDDAEKVHQYRFCFRLPRNHPVFEAIPERLPDVHPQFAWFMRVPDLPLFLAHVKPVLERRIAGSVACGHTGELKISFFRDGLRIALQNGRLTTIEPWRPTVEDQGNAFFPDLTFLHVVFGHRTVDEIREMYADCDARGEHAALLRAMFPARPSMVWQVL